MSESGNRRTNQGSLKEQFKQSRDDVTRPNNKTTRSKKATFAALPNQTTWSDYAALKGTSKSSPVLGGEKNDVTLEESDAGQVTPQAEMLNIRMMLGESRRKIEDGKRKSELQMTKQRQRVGKQAFMQASKHPL